MTTSANKQEIGGSRNNLRYGGGKGIREENLIPKR